MRDDGTRRHAGFGLMLDRAHFPTSSEPARARFAAWARGDRLAVACLCLVGIALRIAAARGDLWLDEIWSLIIVAKTASFRDVVVALPHDNNHVLNSLWLKLVGDQAEPLLARLPAVLFGTLCIPVAARLGARISPAAAIILAMVVAIDFPFLQFGSEARGYSGLILAMLVALDAVETRLEHRTSPESLIVFSLAVAFGTFSHLLMVEATALLCATFAIRTLLDDGVSRAWLRRFTPIPLAAAAGAVPALACVLASLSSGPLHVGLSGPFSFPSLADGLGGMYRATIGFWPAPLSMPTYELLLPLVGFGVVAALPGLPAQRRVLPILGVLGLPLMHAVLRLPNQVYPRFHLVAGVCLALLMAEVGARGWRAGGVARALVCVGGIAFLAGQSLQGAQLLVYGRGSFAEATTVLTRQGAIRLAVLPPVAAPETVAVVRWYARRNGQAADITPVPEAAVCTSLPDWIVVVHRADEPKGSSHSEPLAGRPCADRFEVARRFSSYGMSGFAWTLLKRRSPA